MTGRESVSGVITHQIGPCDVDWYGERSALVVACPGQDLIRVWPLPVEQPWWGDLMVYQSGPMWTLDNRSERMVCHTLTSAGQSRAFGRLEERVL